MPNFVVLLLKTDTLFLQRYIIFLKYASEACLLSFFKNFCLDFCKTTHDDNQKFSRKFIVIVVK